MSEENENKSAGGGTDTKALKSVEEIKSLLQEQINQGKSNAEAVEAVKSYFDPENEDAIITKMSAALKQLEDNQDELTKKMATIKVGGGSADLDDGGFNSVGEYAMAVKSACIPGNTPDQRLVNIQKKSMSTKAAASTIAEGNTGEDGGYMIPAQFAQQIKENVYDEAALVSQTDNMPLSGRSITVPKSEDTPWGGNGITAQWDDEGDVITQSKARLDTVTYRAHRLTALAPVTEELLDDATAMSSFILRKGAEAIRYKADDAIMNGNGVKKPLGILNSDCLVTVSEEGSQTADTIVVQNIVKMYSRMLPSSLPRASWKINQDILPQLLVMTLGNQPIYMPPSGANASPYGTLLGRPIQATQHNKTLGDLGDIVFADMKQYVTVEKGGIDIATSIHLWFDQNLQAFRFIYRLGGAPWMESAITPDNGTNTVSPFVTLEARTGG